MTKKKILITGSSGFIGFNLLKKIRKLDPICIFNKKKLKLKNIKKINLDLTKKKTKDIIKKIDPDVIFHCAALSVPKKNEENKAYSQKINYNTNKFIVDSIKKKTHVIFLSTDRVYGGKKNPKETSYIYPKGVYEKLKRKSELLFMKNLKKIHILRLPIVHGYGADSSSYIDLAINKIKNKSKIYIAKNVFRCFVNINQLISLLIKLIDDKNYGIYNVGSNCMSYATRVKQLCIKKNIQYEKYLFTNKIIANPYRQKMNTKKLKSVFKFNFV